jgi:O-antigen/teichoic acid export membrane protein
LKKTFINIFSGALGYILPIGINIVFTPIIIKNLGSEAYGLQSLVNVIIGFLMVADMGLDIPVTKLVSEYSVNKNPIMLNKLLNTTLQVYFGIGLIGAIIIIAFTPILVDKIFNIPSNMVENAKYVFYLAAIGFSGGLLNMWGKSVFNGILRYDISNSVNVITSVLSILIGTYLVKEGKGVVIYVLVRVLFTLFSGIIYIIISNLYLKGFKISLGINKEIWNKLKGQVGYGFFLRISGIVTSRFDQALIGTWIGVAAVGYYSIAILIVTSIGGLINSMIHFIFPKISQLNSSGNIEKLEEIFIMGSKFVGILIFLIIPPVILFADEILNIWLGNIFANKVYVVLVLLLLATLIQSVFVSVLNNYVIGIGKLKLFTKYTLVRSVVFLLFCFLLIEPFGLIGAGSAMILTTIVDLIFYIFIVSRDFDKQIIVELIIFYFKLLIISIFTCITSWYMFEKSINSIFSLLMFAFVSNLIFLSLSLLLKLFKKNEIKIFKSLINKIIVKTPLIKYL